MYQASVKKLSEESKVTAVGQQGAICQICHKTKFADGIGHKCHYCGVRSCARCGGKMGLKGNKVGTVRWSDFCRVVFSGMIASGERFTFRILSGSHCLVRITGC